MEGKRSNARSHSTTEHLPYLVGVTGDAFSIKRSQIPEYLNNAAFVPSLDAWWFWSQKGTLPEPGGWNNQPVTVKDVIQMFEGCHTAYIAYKKRMQPTMKPRGK